MCVAFLATTTIVCKKRCQGLLKITQIERGSVPNSSKMKIWGVAGVSWEHSVSATRFWSIMRSCFPQFWRHLVDFGCHFGGHWISKGQSTWCFFMFSAQSHTCEKKELFLNKRTAKIEKCKQRKHKKTKVQSTWRFSIDHFQEHAIGAPSFAFYAILAPAPTGL